MKSIRRVFGRARDYRNDAGFTLVEVLITIAIVGMITASVVAAFSLSVKTTTNASNRIKESNTAQFITRFLVADAASAGGFDDQNRSILENGARPGVYIQTSNTGGFCDAGGSILRFEWLTRAAGGSTRVASNYSLNGTDLVRTYCAGAATPTTVVLGRNVSSASPVCIPACAPSAPGQNPVSPPPVIVSMNVTTTSPSLVAYTFTASGFVRAGGSAGTPTSATVPLIALGVPAGSPCPANKGGGVPLASGVAVAQRNTTTSPLDPFEPKITVFGVAAINSNATTAATCGQAGNIFAPTGWFATQTLVVSPGTCNNCGPDTIPIAAPINDPFADLAPPSASCAGSGNPATTVVGNERHYFPGIYRDPVNLVITSSGGRQIDQYIFENTTDGGAGTGVYVFCRGVTIQSGILAQSKPGGVLFYFAPTGQSSLRRIIPGAGGGDDFSDINWQIDGRPEWRDVVIWQSNPTTSTASTTGDLELAIGENDPTSHPLSARYGGVIYAPQAQVEFYLPTRETLGQYQTVEATAAAVVARKIVADRISRIRLGDGPQTTVSLTANPNPATVGQPVTLQATVAPVFPATGTATGAVTFFNDSEQLGTADLVNGVATFSTTALGGGARPLKAIYSGDLIFASSVSPTLNTVLNPAPSVTTLVTNLNPAGIGQPVTFTATVAGVGGGPVPTGTVTFYNDVVPLGNATLSTGGAASLTVTLPQGVHPIRAQYNGDVSYLTSTSAVILQGVKQASVTVLTSSPNPTNAGLATTLTATVAPLSPGPVATGTVTFFDGTVQIGGGSVILDGAGVATLSVSNLTGGNHNLTAQYSGDTLLASSTSSVHVHHVNLAGGAVSLASNLNPSLTGQSVTFTATVATQSGLGAPTGTVTFYDGATPIPASTRTLVGGVATFSTTSLPLGSRSITAHYSGDANYLSATSPALTQLVQAGTTTTLASSPRPSQWGQPVTFTATITESAPGTPAGTVNFYDNGSFIGQANLVGGTTATLVTAATWFDIGNHPITATFVPTGSTFIGSSSAVLNQQVNLATTTLTLGSSLNPVAPGQSFTITATASAPGGTPPGSVYFYDNYNGIITFLGSAVLNTSGVATLTTSVTGAGTHPIDVYYPATGNFQAVQTRLNQVVQLATTSVVVSSSANPATAGQSVTLRADITASAPNPTGLVNFYENGTTFLGSGAVGDNYAVLVVGSGFANGTHPITAEYIATGIFANANSPVFNQVVGQVGTTVASVVSNPNPSGLGQQFEVRATVTASVGTPTGEVIFYRNNFTELGRAPVVAGVSTILVTNATTLGTFALGNSTINAYFIATGAFLDSNGTGTHNVRNATTVTLARTTGTDPATFGQPLAYTATVNDTIAAVPTGTVTFLVNNVPFGSPIALTGTMAVLSNPSLPVGTHSITARYDGNATFAASPASNVVSQTINPAVSAVDIQVASGGDANRPSNADTVTYTFSGSMAPGSLMTGFTGSATAVTVRLQRGAGVDATTNLSICTTTACTTLVNLGTVNLGDIGTTSGSHYLGGQNSSATANATMTMTTGPGPSVVTITINGSFSSNPNNPAGAKTLTWTPSTLATDANGVAMSGVSATEQGANDADF